MKFITVMVEGKLRFLRAVSYLICGVMLLSGQAAYAQSAMLNQELLAKSGVVEAVNGIPQVLLEGLDELRQSNQHIDVKFLSAWKATIPIAYRTEKILAVIDAGLQKELTSEEKQALITFFDSGLGKRVIGLEKASNNATAEIKEYAKRPAAFADRVDLYNELDHVSGASEAGATILQNMSIAMQVGIATAAETPIDIAKLKADAEKERRTVRLEVGSDTLKAMAYTYRSLPVDDVKAYLEFLKTPAAKKFNETLSRFLNDAMTTQTGSLGRLLIQNITSSQPI